MIHEAMILSKLQLKYIFKKRKALFILIVNHERKCAWQKKIECKFLNELEQVKFILHCAPATKLLCG